MCFIDMDSGTRNIKIITKIRLSKQIPKNQERLRKILQEFQLFKP